MVASGLSHRAGSSPVTTSICEEFRIYEFLCEEIRSYEILRNLKFGINGTAHRGPMITFHVRDCGIRNKYQLNTTRDLLARK